MLAHLKNPPSSKPNLGTSFHFSVGQHFTKKERNLISKLIPIYTEGYLDPFFFNPVRGAGKKCEAMAHKRAPQRATKKFICCAF